MRSLPLLSLLATFLVACPGKPTDTGTDDTVDLDGDGVPSSEDCDDTEPGVFPGALEICNGLDDDCDGGVDEDVASTYWRDQDADGFGNVAIAQESCTRPDGYAQVANDCDDADPSVHPDAAEVCDGQDNDCDGVADEQGGETTWADADGDGWGDAAVPSTACDPGPGFADNDRDCDDTTASTHPDAPESCNGVDEDCDGEVDEGVKTTFWADADGDGHGGEATSVEACEAPAGYVPTAEDCDDSDPTIHPGATETCDTVDNDCDGSVDGPTAADAVPWYEDADADGWGVDATATVACAGPSGWSSAGGDCDDTEPAVHPTADETCDTRDEDCDGLVDEDVAGSPTWYADADGDTFGDPATAAVLCSAPAGHVAEATDCDDTDASVHPGADETCDGLDDDCDGLTDEDDALDAPTWYPDADGDGWGAATPPTVACAAPAGHVAGATDCDDADASTHPTAEETCDGEDDDCDGLTDEDDAVDAVPWYADADGDTFGDPTSATVACAAPAGTVADDTDCDDTAAAVHPTADEACNTLDDDCDDLTDEDDAVDAPTWYRDTDADGWGIDSATWTSCTAPAGWAPLAGDCDDGDAATSPGAAEACNGRDDDCDGLVDDELVIPTWYADADADGWGDPATATTACIGATGAVPDGGDCDDLDASVHPAAEETCDNLDNDCDGAIDGASAVDAVPWYPDGDADGWGSDADVIVDCEAPRGALPTGGDCDDTDPAAFPGADETCDGTDDDCDGTVDEPGAVDGSPTWQDADGDGYGDPAVSTLTCGPTEGWSDDPSDCDDADATSWPGAPEACDGVDNDCDLRLDEGCLPVLDHCGTVSADETWDAAHTHTVSCNVLVQGTAGPTLTIAEGAEVVFASGTGLYVGQTSAGRLVVDSPDRWAWFTSAEATPAPGDWQGLYLGPYDTGSSVTGAVIEYAGANKKGGVWLKGSDPTLAACWIRYNDVNGVYAESGAEPAVSDTVIADNEGNGWYGLAAGLSLGTMSVSDTASFAGNTLTGNAGYALSILAAYAGALDASSSFAGNDTDVVVLAADTMDQDATWQALDVPYRADGNLKVEGSSAPTLTLQDGVEIRFASNVGLYVGSAANGALVVEGDVDGGGAGVLLTASASTPAPGDWRGLTFGAYDQDSQVAGLTVEYAGEATGAGVTLSGAEPTFTGCTLARNQGYGLSGTSSAFPAVFDSFFEDNTSDGLYLASNSGLSSDVWPALDGNTFTGNGGHALTLPANHVGAMSGDQVVADNDSDAVQVTTDTVDTTATWAAWGVPFHVTGDLSVGGTGRPVLTLEDGVVLAFEGGAGLSVGSSAWGGLATEGSALGVWFTSHEDAPDAGDWDGLTFGTYAISGANTLTGAIVEYGGDNGKGGVVVSASSVVLTDAILRSNDHAGLYVSGGTVDVSDSEVSDNDGYGVKVDTNGALATSTAGPTFTGNTLTGNTGYPILVPANHAGQLDASSTFTGNGTDSVAISTDYVETSATWQDLDADWLVTGHVYVQGTATPVLTLQDGVTLRFNSGVALYVGNTAPGGLQAVGSGAVGITLTSAKTTPGAGDWHGVTFGGSCDDALVDLVGVLVTYGGGNGYGNLYFNKCDGAVTDSTVAYSSRWGIYRNAASPVLTGISYLSNASGDLK